MFNILLSAISLVMFALWVIGLIASYTMDGLLHVLLLIAVVTAVMRVFRDDDTWA